MKSSRTTLALLASIAALTGLGGTAQQPQPSTRSIHTASKTLRVADMTGTAQQLHRASVDKFMRQASRSFGGGLPRPAGTGWPVATDRRRARKARNVKRNRRAQK